MTESTANSIDPTDPRVLRAAELISEADALVIGAGAGLGVDSGLPDFRGEEGFWEAYPALGRAGISFSAIASPEAFQSAPRRAWGFYGHRLALYRATNPHPGFALLKDWGASIPNGCFVFTSNVDGQFHKAGFDPRRILECHGSIHHLQCMEPCTQETWTAKAFDPDVDANACELRSAPPVCKFCGGPSRPNVLMFGDWSWSPWREQMQTVRLEEWLATVRRPVVIELGAGTAIPSVRQFSERMIHKFDSRLIRINPREATVSNSSHVAIEAGALAGLTAIFAVLSRLVSPEAPIGSPRAIQGPDVSNRP
ncbi:MAG: Sir2 family NAD-dependent protein deacetylase [Betaproteobacteria bacterium]